jgi:hypothetical protein
MRLDSLLYLWVSCHIDTTARALTLKDAKLPEAARKDLLKQIDEIKEVEKRVSKDIGKGHSSIVLFLKDKLIPNYRRNVKAVELQKNIEEMLYNEVYVQAAKFQGVSK